MNKQDKLDLRNKLVDFGVRLGYTVELDAKMENWIAEALEDENLADHFDEEGNMIEECRPAGDCNYKKRHVRVREGKSVTGQICTLIHELSHAIALGGDSWYNYLGTPYLELACESVTAFVSAAVGIDRTKQTAGRIIGYGFGGYLATPLTTAMCNVFCDELGYERFELPHLFFSLQKVVND